MRQFSSEEAGLTIDNIREETPAADVIEEAIREYGKQLLNFAYSYVKDWTTAEDIVQDSFIKAFRKYDTFKGDSSLKTWLYRIAANQCKDYLRSSYFKRIVLSNVLPTKKQPDETNVEEVDEELANQVMKLPVKYREVIILHYYEGLPINQIAELLQMNESTVKTRMRRARLLLKKKLEGSDRHGE